MNIHSSSPVPLWRQILRTNFLNWEKLADFLQLSVKQREEVEISPQFILNLPLRLAQKMAKGTLEDPIVKQFLPTKQERVLSERFLRDPVGDLFCRPEPKLLHKYEGRALLVCTSACAMHCRYCFRQNFDYDTQDKAFTEEFKYIAQDSTIHEIILSGGDPLSLSDERLKYLLDSIQACPHIRRIRFHTRFPIGIPERIDPSFLKLIEQIEKQVYFVVHINHPNELDEEIFSRLAALQRKGVVVLNQSVLLKGVNNNVETLVALCEKLADRGIIPYYLHQLDRVQGAAHFEVSEKEGMKLMQEISKKLSGYALPRYVRETAGEPGKSPIF
jgi:EF-P beta-lysylation protein EpmB